MDEIYKESEMEKETSDFILSFSPSSVPSLRHEESEDSPSRHFRSREPSASSSSNCWTGRRSMVLRPGTYGAGVVSGAVAVAILVGNTNEK